MLKIAAAFLLGSYLVGYATSATSIGAEEKAYTTFTWSIDLGVNDIEKWIDILDAPGDPVIVTICRKRDINPQTFPPSVTLLHDHGEQVIPQDQCRTVQTGALRLMAVKDIRRLTNNTTTHGEYYLGVR